MPGRSATIPVMQDDSYSDERVLSDGQAYGLVALIFAVLAFCVWVGRL